LVEVLHSLVAADDADHSLCECGDDAGHEALGDGLVQAVHEVFLEHLITERNGEKSICEPSQLTL